MGVEGFIVASVMVVFFMLCAACLGCAICFVCCAIPIMKLSSIVCHDLVQSIQNMFHAPNSSRAAASAGTYELVRESYSGYNAYNLRQPVLSAVQMNEDVVEAEAYLVPPLFEVQPATAYYVDHNEGDRETIPKSGYKDVWAAALFLVNVVVICYFAVGAALNTNWKGETGVEPTGIASMGPALILMVTLLITMIVVAVSVILPVWINHVDRVIEGMIWLNICMQALVALLCLLTMNLIGTAVFAFSAYLTHRYLEAVRPRIPFAAAVLSTACAAVRSNYNGLLLVAFGLLLVQVGWMLMWTTATYGIFYVYDPSLRDQQDHSSGGLVLFSLLLSLFWGQELIRAVLQATVSGAVACWWFHPERRAPVRGSLFRAVTTSLGSLCCGSLLVAAVHTLRVVLEHLKSRLRGGGAHRSGSSRRNSLFDMLSVCAIVVADFLLRCLEDVFRYFNKYAYCYVAAYGHGFMQSGKQVTELFANRGWTAIVNDDLIWRALLCGAIVVMAIAVVLGLGCAWLLHAFGFVRDELINESLQMGCALGLLVGGIAASLLSTMLDSSVAMVFVSFAENPSALQANHGDLYNHLVTHWENLYPASLTWASAGQHNSQPSLLRPSSAGSVPSFKQMSPSAPPLTAYSV